MERVLALVKLITNTFGEFPWAIHSKSNLSAHVFLKRKYSPEKETIFMYSNPFAKEIDFSSNSFFGRERELWGVLSRLANPHGRVSSAVYGQTCIGKSWFLKQLEQPDLLAKWDLEEPGVTTVSLNSTEIKPPIVENFWRGVLQQLRSKNIPSSEQRLIAEILAASSIDTFLISQLLDLIAKNNRFFLLLLDNFDSIIEQIDVENPTFLNLLRSLLVRQYKGLGIVMTTIKLLNELCANRFHFDISPFDNVFYPVELKPFNEKETKEFITYYLKKNFIQFTVEEQEQLFKISAGYPEQLRKVCYELFEEKIKANE